jgi:hypothetical protein
MSKPIQNITSQLNNSVGLGSDYPISAGLDYRTGLPICKWTRSLYIFFFFFRLLMLWNSPCTDWFIYIFSFLYCTSIYILVAAQHSFNDLSKASKRSGTNFVRRIQRQSSFILPRKKPPTSNPLQPIPRGTDNRIYIYIYIYVAWSSHYFNLSAWT